MSSQARQQSKQPMGFRQTLQQLNSAQKPGVGVPAYTRWVNRRIARVFAAAAVKFGITPNGVTAISSAASLVGVLILFIFEPSIFGGICAALFLALGYALDSADGQVARVTGASSPAGEWLDHVVDSIRVPLIHVAVASSFIIHADYWGAYSRAWWIPLAFTVLTAAQFMSQILAEQLRNNRGTAAPASGGSLRSFVNLHMDAGTLCWIFVLWGFGAVFVIAYFLLFVANAATVLISMRRKYSSLATPVSQQS